MTGTEERYAQRLRERVEAVAPRIDVDLERVVPRARRRRAVVRGDVGDDEALVRRDPQRAVVHLGDGTQAVEHRALGPVVDPAVLDEERVVPAAVLAYVLSLGTSVQEGATAAACVPVAGVAMLGSWARARQTGT